MKLLCFFGSTPYKNNAPCHKVTCFDAFLCIFCKIHRSFNQNIQSFFISFGLSEILVNELKKIGLDDCRIEGRESNDWKLVDTNDIIVHIFHPEKREFYDLEKMWSEEIPKEKAVI